VQDFSGSIPDTDLSESQAVVTAPVSLRCETSALERFAGRGDLAGVARLLASGTDPNEADSLGFTALHSASKKGFASAMALLLNSKADANIRTIPSRGETPLHYASKYGHAGAVSLLLEHGASPHSRSQKGKLPFDYAVEQGHKKVVDILQQSQGC